MDAQQRPTARILSEQIHVSLRLLPVSLAGQIIGALGIAARFWPLVNHIMLIGWLVALTITIGCGRVCAGAFWPTRSVRHIFVSGSSNG